VRRDLDTDELEAGREEELKDEGEEVKKKSQNLFEDHSPSSTAIKLEEKKMN